LRFSAGAKESSWRFGQHNRLIARLQAMKECGLPFRGARLNTQTT
jgi:hypothetical protein